MTEIKLPEPVGYESSSLQGVIYHASDNPRDKTLPVYTAEQVRQAVLAERERCAKVCDLPPVGRIAVALAAPGCERLRDFYAVGPVQRAAVEEFAERLTQGLAVALKDG